LIFEHFKAIENKFKVSVQNFKNNLSNIETKLKNYSKYYLSSFVLLCDKTKEKLNNIEKLVNLNNPERNLKLGYSIATINGKIIKSVKDVKPKDTINIKIKDGNIDSEVKDIFTK